MDIVSEKYIPKYIKTDDSLWIKSESGNLH